MKQARYLHSRETYAAHGTGFSERADCSVRAAATASGLPYEQVHAVFAKHGRKPRRGTPYSVTCKAHKELFGCEKQVWNGSLAWFAQQFPAGRYIVHVSHHALAVVDGVIHDWSLKPRRVVRWYWKIEPKDDINQKIIAALEEQKRLLTILAS